MKLIDKYRKLQDKAFVKQMVTRSVFASMALEDQEVSMPKIEKLYKEVITQFQFTPEGAVVK